ncbi:MAG: MerR family transcriptional regulator [Marmoricola sp.]
MSAPLHAEESLLTVDELAAVTGMTVRTTRYYAGLGLLPPPERRGRMAYYGPAHRARLELIRALQDHGFTLAAIEKYLARLPEDASVEDLAVQRAMMTSWTAERRESLTRRQVEARAGRSLSDAEVENLVTVRGLRRDGDRFEVLAPFDSAVRTLDLDIPVDAFVKASEAISRHMEELADELTRVVRDEVVAPFREQEHTAEDAARFEQTFSQLRQLTLEGVVAGFQHAANEVISRSLGR